MPTTSDNHACTTFLVALSTPVPGGFQSCMHEHTVSTTSWLAARLAHKEASAAMLAAHNAGLRGGHLQPYAKAVDDAAHLCWALRHCI